MSMPRGRKRQRSQDKIREITVKDLRNDSRRCNYIEFDYREEQQARSYVDKELAVDKDGYNIYTANSINLCFYTYPKKDKRPIRVYAYPLEKGRNWVQVSQIWKEILSGERTKTVAASSTSQTEKAKPTPAPLPETIVESERPDQKPEITSTHPVPMDISLTMEPKSISVEDKTKPIVTLDPAKSTSSALSQPTSSTEPVKHGSKERQKNYSTQKINGFLSSSMSAQFKDKEDFIDNPEDETGPDSDVLHFGLDRKQYTPFNLFFDAPAQSKKTPEEDSSRDNYFDPTIW